MVNKKAILFLSKGTHFLLNVIKISILILKCKIRVCINFKLYIDLLYNDI
jgi:hypothetical protein